jgi:hypothetical protein
MTYFTPFLNRIAWFATPANSLADYDFVFNHSHRAGCTALNDRGEIIDSNNLVKVPYSTPEISMK